MKDFRAFVQRTGDRRMRSFVNDRNLTLVTLETEPVENFQPVF